MVSRVSIHTRNLIISIRWLFYNYYQFKEHLELRDYYALSISKIWLWKKDAQYFTVYNTSGACFFIKMKTREKVDFEASYQK